MSERSYEDGCATAHAMDLIGDRWALLIVRELMFGPKRFSDLRTDLGKISTNVLTQRLTDLEASGILVRRRMPPPAASWIYELTDWGRDLEEPILSLGRWAARSPSLRQGLPMSPSGLLLAMRAMFDPRRSGPFRVRLEMPQGQALLEAANGHLDVRAGPELPAAAVPGAVLSADTATLDALIFGGLALEEAVASGAASVSGDLEVTLAFLKAFEVPQPAPRA